MKLSGIQHRVIVAVLVSFLAPLFFASSTLAQEEQHQEDIVTHEGMAMRVQGDITIGPEETTGVVIVIQGNTVIRGTVDVLVQIEGNATIAEGGTVGEVVAVNSTITAESGSAVTANVNLIDSRLDLAEGITVGGEVTRGASYDIGKGFFIFGLVANIGFGLAILLGGVIIAAVAPVTVRRTATAISSDLGSTLIAALIFWLGLPVLAVVAMITIIGIPVGLGFFVFILPAFGFTGYLIVGIWLGELILRRTSQNSPEHERPYLAALVGLGILIVVGWIPALGVLITLIATLLGGGAIALAVWRSFRRKRSADASAEADVAFS